MLLQRSDLHSDILTLFEYIIRIKIKNKGENEDYLDLFLNGPNFIRNGVSISMMLIKAIFYKLLTRRDIFQLAKYKYEGVSESIDSDDRNFSFIVLAELLFYKPS